MSSRLIGHTLPKEGKVAGAAALLCVLSTMILGPLTLPLLLLLLFRGWYTAAAALAAFLAWPFVVEVQPSASFARLYLRAAGWFDRGVTAWFEERVIERLADNNGSLWCMHPHGTSVGMGFTLNGAVRYKADLPAKFLPQEVTRFISSERLARISGVMAPILFKIPLIRPLLLAFGCCTPVTKKGMISLFAKRSDFGMLPGGMEEVLLYEHGRDVVFLRKRKGFIKYALQHGYLLVLGYTFGEADLYRSLSYGRQWRMWAMRRFGFVLPIFWGPRWYCPLLPDDQVAINTVVGSPLQLPQISSPTTEEVLHFIRRRARRAL
jgi:hypothetical protein